MRGSAREFTPLEPAFRREEYEGQYEGAQNVVLPGRAPVRPENYLFEYAPEHKTILLDIRRGMKNATGDKKARDGRRVNDNGKIREM